MSILDSLKGTAFSSNNDDRDVVKGDTGDGPYEQFEQCRHKDDFKCKFIANDGGCIFETCVMDDHEPPRVLLWYFHCIICDREDTVRPEEHRAPFCKSCIQRMLKAEKLPHKCVMCGKTVNSPAVLFLSGICDSCYNDLKNMLEYWRDGKDWPHCRH